MTCQEAFEKWFIDTYGGDQSELVREPAYFEQGSIYKHISTFQKWKCWKAAWLAKAEIENAGAIKNEQCI